jgi:hypothetical protein
MEILGKMREARQRICKHVENAFRSQTAQILLAVRQEILEQVKAGIAVNGNQFLCEKLMVRLQPPTKVLQDAFDAAFLQEGSLKTGILELLKGVNTEPPKPLEVIVELKRDLALSPEASSPRPLFQIEFIKHDPSIRKEAPETSFVISKGSAEQATYTLKKDRILIGRLQEVLDREGRVIRRNDVIFLDDGDDINSTVSRAHARIWFDFEKNDFFIMDEVSRLGTIVVREGRSIESPAGNPHGIRLRSGDAIYCGQACLRFELIAPK